MSFEPSFAIASGAVDMASSNVEEHLLYGWFEGEYGDGRAYRWAGEHSAVMVRVEQVTSSAFLSYRTAPAPAGEASVSVRPADSRQAVWSTRLSGNDGGWHDDILPVRLEPGDYVVSFDAEATWSNPGMEHPGLPPENRSLSLALSRLSFGA
jgi:hypothetical protein